MSADIVKFRPRGYNNNPDAILEEAAGAYETVLLIGWNKDGSFDARGSIGDGPNLLWLVEAFKTQLMNGDFMGDGE